MSLMDEAQRLARNKERKARRKLARQKKKEEREKRIKQLLANPPKHDFDPNRIGRSLHHFNKPVHWVQKEGEEFKEKNKVVLLKNKQILP